MLWWLKKVYFFLIWQKKFTKNRIKVSVKYQVKIAYFNSLTFKSVLNKLFKVFENPISSHHGWGMRVSTDGCYRGRLNAITFFSTYQHTAIVDDNRYLLREINSSGSRSMARSVWELSRRHSEPGRVVRWSLEILGKHRLRQHNNEAKWNEFPSQQKSNRVKYQKNDFFYLRIVIKLRYYARVGRSPVWALRAVIYDRGHI